MGPVSELDMVKFHLFFDLYRFQATVTKMSPFFVLFWVVGIFNGLLFSAVLA